MPIRCPQCGKQHDVLEMEPAGEVTCSCGRKLDLSLLTSIEDFLRYFENEEERDKALAIQEEAQNICRMILDEDFSEADIEIAKKKLREKVHGLFPGKMQTYQLIYESRFKRLWDQFRA
jgi:hypothetical protein